MGCKMYMGGGESNEIWIIIYHTFYGFIDSTAEESDRKQGGGEGEWHAAKGPRQAHGMPTLPTELNGAPLFIIFNNNAW